MSTYHFHHPEKMFADRAELLDLIAGQHFMTLAMAAEGQPYLITVNYGFDPERNCFYFHCAPEGKKIAYLRANPNVWGQVIEPIGQGGAQVGVGRIRSRAARGGPASGRRVVGPPPAQPASAWAAKTPAALNVPGWITPTSSSGRW